MLLKMKRTLVSFKQKFLSLVLMNLLSLDSLSWPLMCIILIGYKRIVDMIIASV